MRLFVGVPIPDEIQEKIALLQKSLPDGISLVPALNLHFTLKFLGDVRETSVETICKRLEDVALEHTAFRVSVKEVGVFKPGFIRVVWVGLKSDTFIALTSAVQQALAHVRKEEYATIVPHLTIARVRSQRGRELLLSVVKVHAHDYLGGFIVDTFVLYQSVLKQTGPEYSVVREFRLLPISEGL